MRSPVCAHPVSHQTQLITFVFKMQSVLSHQANIPYLIPSIGLLPPGLGKRAPNPPGQPECHRPSGIFFVLLPLAGACSWCQVSQDKGCKMQPWCSFGNSRDQ